MRAIEKIIGGGVALALGALLAVSAAPAVARAETHGAFEVTGGKQGTDYTYTAPSEYETNGGDVLTIKSGTALTISTKSGSGTAGGCRIVIDSSVIANITLDGVNITPADAGTNDGYSGIDLGNNATLNITLQSGSSNVINGGTTITGLPGPGIHVPEDATLTITGNGSLEVNGASTSNVAAVGIGGKGSVSTAGEACGNVLILGGTITVQSGTATSPVGKSAVDIGGGATDNGNGGDCGTVIILTSVNSGGSLEIGGGAGAAVGGGQGSDGVGIKPAGDGTYTVYGDLTLPCDITIPEGATVTIPGDASITVPSGTTLTNNGTITGQGSLAGEGTLANRGDISVADNDFMAAVEVSASPSPATYGGSVTLRVTVKEDGTPVNGGTVAFYQDSDALNGTGTSVDSGTAAHTIDALGWTPGDYAVTAVYTPADGSGLIESSGSTTLTVNKAQQPAPGAPTVSTTTSPTAYSITLDAVIAAGQGAVQYGYTTDGETAVPEERWQSETTFDGLTPGTAYTFHARYAGTSLYEPSPASAGTLVTTERADSTLTVVPTENILTYGETLTITVAPEQTAANGINALTTA